ncbi:MAG: GntR family transcriptional regulator [Myxococcota bacterium]
MAQRTRTEEVMSVLRREVLEGQYRPGERLPSERDLAARFQTTRGIVRVALKKLEQLGIADVQPGGARVVPVEQASLDVVGHLLALQDPPDPDLVDQVLEVAGALVAASARIAVERGDPAQLERARELIHRIQEPELGEDARLALADELGHLFMNASNNLVLHLVRRGLRTQVFRRLYPWRASPELAQVDHLAKELDRAIDQRDPARASEAVHSLWLGMRHSVRSSLEAARSEARVANP